jgi:quercetin dioxygenase-like cupin family protein
MTQTRSIVAVALAIPLVLGTPALRAQDGITRTDIQTHDLSIPGREVVQQMAELQPGAVVAKHTHPGEEVTVVLEGELLLEVAGAPPATLKAGQAFTVLKGTVHGARNAGSTRTKMLVTFIVEKGKPLRTLAP